MDCEDFSIAKYFTMLPMDIPEEQLVTYVILDNSQGHMVLFYYSDPLVLDNMRNDILQKSKRTDIKYKFSFNDDGLLLKGNYSSDPDKNQYKKILTFSGSNNTINNKDNDSQILVK